jgi:hypothetical protein
VLAIFLVPAFFVAVLRLVEARKRRKSEGPSLHGALPAGENS